MNNVKQVIFLSVIAGLLGISGCAYKNVQPTREIRRVERAARATIDQPVQWQAGTTTEYLALDEFKQGFTCEQVVGFALRASPVLQAKFRDLGVAKADLEKAGLYKNPYLTTIIQFPDPNPLHSDNYIEVDLSWNVADLWLVPYRKKISDDQLEIATFDVMDTILEIRMNAQLSYNKCVQAMAQLEYAQEVRDQVQKLYDIIRTKNEYEQYEIHERMQDATHSGSILDNHAVFVLISQMDIAVVNALFAQKTAFMELATMIGMPLEVESIVLREELIDVEPSNLIYDLAFDNPKLMKAHLKIQQERHRKSLEKARFLEDVSVGFSYNNQPVRGAVTLGGPRFLGPMVNLSLPVFDNKYADIARADFLIQKAENEYVTVQDALMLKIQLCKAEIESVTMIINHSQRVIASYEKIIEQEDADHQKGVAGINTYIELFDKKSTLLKYYLQLHNAIALLEQTVGKKILR